MTGEVVPLRDRRVLRFANSEQLAEAARISARLAVGVCDWCAVSHGSHEYCSATAKARAACACDRAGHPHTRREDEE